MGGHLWYIFYELTLGNASNIGWVEKSFDKCPKVSIFYDERKSFLMSKKFTEEMVDSFADKLLIGLSREENAMVLNEFDVIDENIAMLESLPNIKEVEPMSWCLDRCIESLREDVVEKSVSLDELLANSDGTSDREIVVKRVVGE